MKKKKEYTAAEDQSLIVNEPAIVYPGTKQVRQEDNDLPFPCQYTIEELREDAEKFLEELENGTAELIPHEKVRRK